MEAAAGVAAVGRGISLSMPSSQSSRKEWRVVSETSVRNSSNEELVRSKLGHSDERLIYEVLSENDAASVGCAVSVVNEAVSVYLKLRGTINAEAKHEKLKKKMGRSSS